MDLLLKALSVVAKALVTATVTVGTVLHPVPSVTPTITPTPLVEVTVTPTATPTPTISTQSNTKLQQNSLKAVVTPTNDTPDWIIKENQETDTLQKNIEDSVKNTQPLR